MIAGFFIQALRIVLGYILGWVAAGTFASLALVNVLVAATNREDWDGISQTMVFSAVSASDTIPSALWFALIAIVITEGLRLRSVFTYIVLGTVLGLLTRLPVGQTLTDLQLPALTGHQLAVAAATGIVGSLVYWVIAGRAAGRWTERS